MIGFRSFFCILDLLSGMFAFQLCILNIFQTFLLKLNKLFIVHSKWRAHLQSPMLRQPPSRRKIKIKINWHLMTMMTSRTKCLCNQTLLRRTRNFSRFKGENRHLRLSFKNLWEMMILEKMMLQKIANKTNPPPCKSKTRRKWENLIRSRHILKLTT